MSIKILPLFLLLLPACNRTEPRQEVMEMISSANNVSEDLVLQMDPTFYQGTSKLARQGDTYVSGQRISGRHMIAKGEYRFSVQDLDSSRASIQRMLKATGGYAQGDELSDWGDRMVLIMRVRIPAEKFDTGARSLQSLGKLEHQMMQVFDVSEEWTDVQARLKAKRVLEGRYLELIAKSNKVSELLEVERELGKVRSEIESMEARIRSLGDQVAMSTLTITCISPSLLAPGAASNIALAFARGADHFGRFILELLGFWPFILIIMLALIGLQYNKKILRRKKAKVAAA